MKSDKKSDAFWKSADAPTAEQLVEALKEAGVYKDPDKKAIKRAKEMERLIKEADEWRDKHSKE